jgi:DNA repair exonuclease SbcCD ATPase subunit
VGLTKYIKTAFLNRWNMLLFLGGCAFAALSGRPDVVGPIVLAAEVGYLGLLGTHPRFQRYVDAQEAAGLRQRSSQSTEQVLQQILKSLARPSMMRFERLRGRCHELRQIAADLKKTSATEIAGNPLDSLHLEGLDRLLWIFLRMLYTQQALTRFLERTSAERIQADIQQVQSRLSQLAPDDTSPHGQKMRRALEDNLQTSKDRHANFEKARSNLELLELELDRLENKIKSLAELAVNRQEPDFISGQVDQVAHSMLETEKTMNDLRFATGLEMVDDEAPELLRYPPVHVIE